MGRAFRKADIGRVFTWDEVSDIHRSQHGIYQRDGTVISLLTDLGRITPCYPDTLSNGGKTLTYTGSGRRGDQKLDVRNRALLDAASRGRVVPLFNKLGVNRWEYMGRWRITAPRYVFDEAGERMVWQFTLESAD